MPKNAREDGQVDLFLPQLTTLPLRDQRETMERPFFSLSKRKRLKPIDYVSPDRKITVHVTANSEYGLATIYDLDILIYCASVLNGRPYDTVPTALPAPNHRPPEARVATHPPRSPDRCRGLYRR